MAERWAVATGNWSATGTWNGGTLPASGDDVYANNFTVTVDQNVVANSLRINAGSTAVAGGKFTCSTTRTIALQELAVGAHTGASTAVLELTAGAVTLTVASTITGDSSTTGTEPPAINCTGGSHVVTADVTGGASAQSRGVVVTGGAIEINGDVLGGSASTSYGVLVSAGEATVNGSATGGADPTAPAVQVSVGAAATVRGDTRPGTYSTGGAGAPAIVSLGVLRVSGDVYSGGMTVSTGPNGFFPIQGNWTVIDGEDIRIHLYNDDNYPSGNNGSQTVLTRYGTSNPAIEDVRAGVIYGISDQLEGTLAVPPPASVAAGVPTDDTVGTAALGLADVLAGTGAQIAAATSG
jgi:hypothetical protein